MMVFFPDFYEDELLYSLLARYHVHSGNPTFRATATDLYRRPTVHPDMEFVNAYTEEAMNWICREQPFEKVIEKHTMYPAYARFLPHERRQKAFQHLIQCEGICSNDMAIPNTGKRFLRFCPCCAAEDREAYGETYWHRSHQIQRIQVCPKHECYLESSAIMISGKSSPDLHPAELSVPVMQPRPCADERLLKFTAYVLEVTQAPVNLSSQTAIGVYLNSRLDAKYHNRSGLVRNISQLYRDYTVFYNGMEPMMTLPQMQKVFNGYLFDYYFICQLAFFEGLTVRELTKLPEMIVQDSMKPLMEQLSREHGVDYETVCKISETVLKQHMQQSRIQRASGIRSQAWDELDDKLLPQVIEAVDAVYHAEGRPQKVSVTGIQRRLGLAQKQFHNLPKCKAYIEKHTETQPMYWAREVVWAIGEVEASGQELNWKRIRELTNMKPNDLRCCMEFISDADVLSTAQRIASNLE